MIFIETKDCQTHRYRQDYVTLLCVWQGSENNFRPFGFTGNWQPRDDEVLELVRHMVKLSPTFRDSLVAMAGRLQEPPRGKRAR